MKFKIKAKYKLITRRMMLMIELRFSEIRQFIKKLTRVVDYPAGL